MTHTPTALAVVVKMMGGMVTPEERKLRNELEAARQLAGHQLYKIRRLEERVATLERQLHRCRATVAEMMIQPHPVELHGLG
jgi:hypothetical protein